MLELKNVHKIYKTKSGSVGALNGVSLTFPATGLVFVTGKSGCGKTTLLNVIGGLDGIDDGEICLLGKSFASFTTADYDDYRNTFIGFIFQEYNLLSEYTVEKNIEIAMELQGRPSNKEELDALLAEMEIEHLKNRKPLELSGGQRQRVAIARALVKQPRIIMADEPTGALDSKTGVQVMEILKKLSKKKLIIIVSHDDELAERYADRVIKLIDGVVDSDVTFSESQMESNVTENDKTLLVKAGADLNEAETKAVVKAVKNSKKIELINNILHRKVVPTEEDKIQKTTDKFELKRSKMKLKSSVSLGVKSLIVKPVRLAFTILLAVMAFAVFGLFDTVANFSTTKVVNNLLRTTSNTVVAYGEYIIDDFLNADYDVKLSQSELDRISKETGLNAKGIYDFADNASGQLSYNPVILELGGYDNYRGKYYYTRIVNGFVEFKDSEFADDGKTVKDFGFKIVNGRYPKLRYDTDSSGKLVVNQESLYEVAISTYLAESIVKILTEREATLNGKFIETTDDLIGSSFVLNSVKYTIVGLMDCGAIPKKYDVLKDQLALTEETSLLSEDLSSFIASGLYECLFMADGHREEVRAKNNEAYLFYGGQSSWTVAIPGNGTSRHAEEFVYSQDKYYNDQAVFFDGEKNSAEKISLGANEVLIHGKNVKTLFEKEIASVDASKKETAENLAKDIGNETLSPSERKIKFDQLMTILGITEKTAKEKSIYVTKQLNIDVDDQVPTQEVKVVGFYCGIDLDNEPSSTKFRFMMGNDLMETFEIYLGQGEYSKFIVRPNDNAGGTKVIADYMLATEGLSLVWYSNFALHTVQSNETIIRQGADLFLYISLALAAFSVFMLFNYIATSIVNKRPTIGVLRGLGSRGMDILRIFLSESIIIALINGILATAVTALGCVFVNTYIANVMNIAIPFALFGLRQVGMIFGLSVATAIVSCTLPIIRIAKRKPVDLIRTIN